MRQPIYGAIALALLCTGASGAERGIRFWNLTSATIVTLHMSPAGQNAWGPNQCENDRDGTVDHDERLRITGIGPGRYDVRVAYKGGRTCTIRNVEVKSGGIFSIADRDLTDCTK